MKFSFKFMICFFIIGILIGGFLLVHSYSSEMNNLISETSDNMINISEEKTKKINEYLFKIENDTQILAESDEVKLLLKSELSTGVFSAEKQIKKKAEDVTKEIEAYLILHPNMTIKDLQNSEEFKKIAVQKIGKTGYTALTDYETLTCRFHSNPKIVDLDLHTLSEKLPGFWEIMSSTEGGVNSGGFYDWQEADGRIEKKYM